MKQQRHASINNFLTKNGNGRLYCKKALFYGLFCISMSLIVSSCKNELEEIEAITQKKIPVESAENIEMIFSDSARVQFVLKAPVLERYIEGKDTSYVMFPKGVDVVFFDNRGEQNSSIKADYAVNYQSEEKLFLKNNVEVVNDQGDRLNTEELWWEKEKDSIYTDKFVTITTEDEILYGDTLVSNGDFSRYKIKSVEGTFNVKDEELP